MLVARLIIRVGGRVLCPLLGFALGLVLWQWWCPALGLVLGLGLGGVGLLGECVGVSGRCWRRRCCWGRGQWLVCGQVLLGVGVGGRFGS